MEDMLLQNCSDQVIEEVIAYVQDNRAIYDIQSRGYKNTILKKNIMDSLNRTMKNSLYKDGKFDFF